MSSWLQSIFTSPILNPDTDTTNFINYFDTKYSNEHPNFLTGSYQLAVEKAFQQSKLLIVYMHSPLHVDSDEFCNKIICSASFIEYTNSNFLFWAGSMSDMEAYSLSIQLKTTSFPFLTVFMCQSKNAVQIADRFNGTITGAEATDEGTVIDRLNLILEAYTVIIDRGVSEVESR